MYVTVDAHGVRYKEKGIRNKEFISQNKRNTRVGYVHLKKKCQDYAVVCNVRILIARRANFFQKYPKLKIKIST